MAVASSLSDSTLPFPCDEQDYALKVISETNESWNKLIKRSIPAGELSLV